MERLSSHQREALEHLQGIMGRRNYDLDVLTNVLQSLDWDVQRATDLLLNETDHVRPVGRASRDRPTRPVPDNVDQGREAPRPYSLMRTLFSLLYLPIGLVSSILRFVSGILRIPLLPLFLNASTNYRVLRPAHPDSRSATRRWITSLEEETGAVSVKSATVTATGLDGRQAASRRHTYPPSGPGDECKLLPDFFDGTYEAVLDVCQKEGRIACVVLVSAEHDDVAEFKRSTLTHPGFVRMLGDNHFVVWGGDIRDRDAWEAAQKLQATTYPFVAFVALQPRRNHASTSSVSTSSPMLTVLSRHYGPSVPDSGPTSAHTLVHHLEHQLLPRVSPFLAQLTSQLEERERDRVLREQQDRAFQESAERDRERIQVRIRAEQEEAERVRLEKEARVQEQQQMQLEREKQESTQAVRLQYRRWMRRCIVPTQHGDSNGIRLAIKLPGNTRVVRSFFAGSTLTELYAFADVQMLPLTLQPDSDPECIVDGPGSDLQKLESYIQSHASGAEAWWGFKLALSYPRREIRWVGGLTLVDAGLKSGEQLVMELVGNTKAQHCSDDDYESEDD